MAIASIVDIPNLSLLPRNTALDIMYPALHVSQALMHVRIFKIRRTDEFELVLSSSRTYSPGTLVSSSLLISHSLPAWTRATTDAC